MIKIENEDQYAWEKFDKEAEACCLKKKTYPRNRKKNANS